MGKCIICGRKIYTGIYCTDCMYADTSLIPKWEKEQIKKETKSFNDLEKEGVF